MTLAKFGKIAAGVLGFVATVFAIIQGFRDYRPPVPKLQAAVVNVEHVSSRTEIPDVKISLAFKDQSVSDLWLVRIRLQNIGGITLYTTGSRPNTKGPLFFTVPEKYEILRVEPKGIDPKDSGFDAQISQTKDDKGVPDKQQLEVAFEQWRKGEAIEAVLYLAGAHEQLEKPKLISKGRPILDGDIVSVDSSTVAAPEIKRRSNLFDRWINPTWGLILRVYALLTVTLIAPSALAGSNYPLRNLRDGHPRIFSIVRLILALGLYAAIFAIMP